MAVILITGANGQLGSELRNSSKDYYGYDFIFTDISDLDISSPDKTVDYIHEIRPDWIINCAAYNFVDKAEDEYDKALMVNATAVRNIVEAIKDTNCRFIHVSSDYVFDGEANTPYNENTAVNPRTAYGRTKLEGEKSALLHHGTMIIRTSWLYSQYGSNFVKTILAKAKEHDSLKVVFDQTGSPTYAADLAEAILNIIAGVIRNRLAFIAGVYHYSNEGVCSWYDLAQESVKKAGINCKVIPILSKDFQAKAKRPSYSVLDKSRIKENYNLEIPHWRDSLKKCIEQIM